MDRIEKISLIKNVATRLATMEALTATILLREFNWPFAWFLEGNFDEKSRAVVDFLQSQEESVLAEIDEHINRMTDVSMSYEAKEKDQHARIRIFMSHKKEYRQIASEFKRLLDYECFDTFVAHEDIQDNELWKDSIKRDLTNTNVFVALVTDDFEQSVWCQQEVGWAVARNILTMGINFREPVPPLGFLGEQQLIKFIEYNNSVSRIKKVILENQSLKEIWRLSVLKEIGESINWNQVRHYWKMISNFDNLTTEETSLLRRAYDENEYVSTVSINYGEDGVEVLKYLEKYGK